MIKGLVTKAELVELLINDDKPMDEFVTVVADIQHEDEYGLCSGYSFSILGLTNHGDILIDGWALDGYKDSGKRISDELLKMYERKIERLKAYNREDKE